MVAPDVTITPVYPAGAPPIRFGLLGDGVLSVYSSGGYPWVAIDRPLRKGFVEFNSIQLQQLVLPLILDRADTGGSVEAECNTVHGWRYPVPGRREPPPLRVTGPFDSGGVTEWVLFAPVWKGAQRRADFARTQQEIELTLLEASFIDRTFGPPSPAVQVQQQAAATGASVASAIPSLASLPAGLLAQLASVPAGAWRDYVVKVNEDLLQIAAKQLGDQRLWQSIAALNGLRDPANLLAGIKIKLPW